MGLRDYLRVARRNWWLVVASVVLALSVATGVTVRTPPIYAASVTFFFTTPNAGAADLYPAVMFSEGRLKSYAALLTSDRITEPLARTPGVGLSAEEVAEQITAETVADTVMLLVTVEDRSRTRAQLLATALVKEFQNVVISLENPSTVRMQVVAGPKLEDDPVAPRPLDNLALGLLVGLIIGAAAAVAREVSDSTIRTADALQALAAAPVLARIPVDANAPSRSGPFVSDSSSARAEALRQLRTNLQYADGSGPVKTVAVTSAVPGEGRSATACSLALLFAESGLRVLIVDAELRHPRLASFLGREGSAGLSTVLTGAASVKQVLQPWGAGLWLLSSGHRPPNPSELVSSQRMTELIGELRELFDIVIFDCPPLLPVTDAAAIVARTDGALLVVRSRKTKGAQVTTAVRSLRAVNARILGCVLNMVPANSADAFPNFENYSAPQSIDSFPALGERPAAEERPALGERPAPAERPAAGEGPAAGETAAGNSRWWSARNVRSPLAGMAVTG
ncbi:polysaccharide biosynthesis tyrosine autokinase [Micromonosporaceae bacterium Da 78-11]